MSEVVINGPKIYLKNVRVIFATLEDEGFGRSLTIDATDKDIKAGIEKWVKENKIGKDHPGEANFKTYEDIVQYNLRLNDKSKFVYRSGVPEGSLGYNAEVSIAANAFEYNNKFGKGTSASISAVVVEKAATTGADADIAELLDLSEEEKAAIDKVGGGTPVDVSEIPFNK
jgi:hypothetical protein